MGIKIIKPDDQAYGQFDGGKIKEQKPIGFSREGSLINRLGLYFTGLGDTLRDLRKLVYIHIKVLKSSLM